MLYFVKVRIDAEKLVRYGNQLQSGLITTHPISTYCLKDDPAVGLNIWEADNLEEFERAFSQHKQFYTDVMEVVPVISAIEAQQVLMAQITKAV